MDLVRESHMHYEDGSTGTCRETVKELTVTIEGKPYILTTTKETTTKISHTLEPAK